MLGRYDEFPADAFRSAQFVYLDSFRRLQTAIARTMRRLNQRTIDLATITGASPPNCYVNFEFGIADADVFHYLDRKQLSTIERALKAQSLPILDAFCAIRYHIREEKGRDKPLQFDYSVFRLTFENQDVELFLHYIRGIQRIPRKDFIHFLKDQIDKELAEKKHKTLELKSLF